ncbi:hypothetical protein SPFM14_00282 [Salmonella phage SPFM14]|nr:hypothetical protein SPFM14_00282 [Salmonella phage SPFM14]
MFEDTLPKMQRCLVHSGKLENGMEFGAFRNVIEGCELAVMAVKQYIYNTMIFDMVKYELSQEMNEIKPAFYPVVGPNTIRIKDPGMFVYSTKLVEVVDSQSAMPRIASPEVEVLVPPAGSYLDGATSGVLASTQRRPILDAHISVTPVAGQAYTNNDTQDYFSRVYYLDDIKTGVPEISRMGQYQEVDLQGVPWVGIASSVDNEIQQRVIREILGQHIPAPILQAAFVPENLKLPYELHRSLRMNVIDYCLRKISRKTYFNVRQWDSITRWYELWIIHEDNIYAKFLRVWCAHKGSFVPGEKLKNMRVIEKCSLSVPG